MRHLCNCVSTVIIGWWSCSEVSEYNLGQLKKVYCKFSDMQPFFLGLFPSLKSKGGCGLCLEPEQVLPTKG